MSFTDDLRRAATEPVPDLADLLVTAAWHLDRAVQGLARARGVPEDVIRIELGLTLYPTRPAVDLVEPPRA